MTATATPTRPKAAKNAKAAKSIPVATFETPTDTPLIQDMGGELRDVPLTDVLEPTWAPDRIPGLEDQAEIEGLARSMHAATQLQPILLELTSRGLVRVFGRRRVAAARLLGWKTIRATVVPELSEVQRRTVIAVENIQRKQLTAVEETIGVAELIELQALEAARQVCQETRTTLGNAGAWSGRVVQEVDVERIMGCPPDQIAANRHDVLLDHRVRDRACVLVGALLSRDAKWVRDRMYIGRLGTHARELIRAGKLPLQHAREIAKVADEDRRRELAEAYAAGGNTSISDTEPGRFIELQNEVSRCLMSLEQAPWKLDVEFAGRPACVTCHLNSVNQPGLFEHGGRISLDMVGGVGRGYEEIKDKDAATGICTGRDCYAAKLRVAKQALADTASRVVDRNQAARPEAIRILDKTAINEKVSERRRLRQAQPRTSSGGGEDTTRPGIAPNPRRMAEGKFEDAMRQYLMKREHEIAAKVIGKEPVRCAYATLLASYLSRVAAMPKAKMDRAFKSPEFISAVKCLTNPTGKDFVAIANLYDGGCPDEFFPCYENGADETCLRVVAVLGLSDGPAPKLEDFMPKPAATDAAADPAKPASKKKASKKAKKGRKA